MTDDPYVTHRRLLSTVALALPSGVRGHAWPVIIATDFCYTWAVTPS